MRSGATPRLMSALGHRKGFARAGSGHHQYVILSGSVDDGRLFYAGNKSAHACLVSNTVSSLPAQAGQTPVIRQ